jgi:hypothetical protein
MRGKKEEIIESPLLSRSPHGISRPKPRFDRLLDVLCEPSYQISKPDDRFRNLAKIYEFCH